MGGPGSGRLPQPKTHVPIMGDVTGTPAKPKWLRNSVAVEFWESTVPSLVAMGQVGEIDAPQLAAMAMHYAIYVKAIRSTKATMIEREKAYKMFDAIASRYGLTAKDRQGTVRMVGKNAPAATATAGSNGNRLLDDLAAKAGN